MQPYYIIEIANTHGGDLKYLNHLIDDFESYQGRFGMKFQPFKYDQIALPDFSWYHVYEELYFTPEEWKTIILKTSKTKDVWLDMFDLYSVQILNENLSIVHGIKLQASTLYNYRMLEKLGEVDLSDKLIQVNIAGYEIPEIQSILARLKESLKPKAFIIQFGFQNYPTEFGDAGLSKIKTLKEAFPDYELCFADHLDGKSEEALLMPLVAYLSGCTYIEKHVYHAGLETKYDLFSSVNIEQFTSLVNRISNYSNAFEETFINEREEAYLKKTMQIPVLNKDLKAGDLISIENDLDFKRTDQQGISMEEIVRLQKSVQVLNKDLKAGSTIKAEDFRKAKLATIVACRMKSSRLPKKAILPIGDLTSIELCLKNVMKFKHTDYTILATSTTEEDAQLKEYTYSKDVVFHQGHPEDVIQRYLDIIDKLEIDIIMRVTGDCPYLSADIQSIILENHLEKGATYSTAPKACIGMNTEVINSNGLRTVKKYFPLADYSEYMTYYFTNNPSYFTINKVELPTEYVRDYRMTLDYQDDLDLFRKTEAYFKENGIQFSARALYDFLDAHPDIANSNKHCTVVYRDDDELIQRIKKATTIIE